MSGVDRLLFPDPTEAKISVERKPVEATCPKCQSKDVRRYPVANYIGPKMVTKCQKCFHHLATDNPTPEDRWPPWRSATFDWPASRNG